MRAKALIGSFMLTAAVLTNRPANADGVSPAAAPPPSAFTLRDHCGVDPWVRPSWLVINPVTGAVVKDLDKDGDRIQYPASLTKMMVAYLAFEALQNNGLKATDLLSTSKEAAAQFKTKLGLKEGDKIAVEDALWGMTVHSSNDAAFVLAEAIGKNVKDFVQKMNDKAKTLGLDSTTFQNPTGLPDAEQKTTARDMATLVGALQTDFPSLFERYFNRDSFGLRPKGQKKPHSEIFANLNPLLNWHGENLGKSGYTCSSGYNLAVKAFRGSHRLVAVVMGEASWSSLQTKMKGLLDKGFAEMYPADTSSETVIAQNELTGAMRPVLHVVERHRVRRHGRGLSHSE